MLSNIKTHQHKNRCKILVNYKSDEYDDSIKTTSVVRKKHSNINREKKIKNLCNIEEISLVLLEECVTQENETSGNENCRSIKDKCEEYQSRDEMFTSIMNNLDLMVKHAKLHKRFHKMCSILLAEECDVKHFKLKEVLMKEFEVRCNNATLFIEVCTRQK